MKKALLAAILSLVIPGVGQLYNKQIVKGVLLIIFSLLPTVFWYVMLSMGFSLFQTIWTYVLMFVIWIYAIIDAYRTAKKINSS